jgi:hypothetical protein
MDHLHLPVRSLEERLNLRGLQYKSRRIQKVRQVQRLSLSRLLNCRTNCIPKSMQKINLRDDENEMLEVINSFLHAMELSFLQIGISLHVRFLCIPSSRKRKHIINLCVKNL